jgi:hypothetical protein
MLGEYSNAEALVMEINKFSNEGNFFKSFANRVTKIVEHNDYSNLYFSLWS